MRWSETFLILAVFKRPYLVFSLQGLKNMSGFENRIQICITYNAEFMTLSVYEPGRVLGRLRVPTFVGRVWELQFRPKKQQFSVALPTP